MPIYQGKYVAPVWVNDQPPAINQTELLAMSGTIADSQILSGSGAPTQYTEGTVGQVYENSDTGDIYLCTSAGENSYVWTPWDDNLAQPYSSSSTYSKGDFCTHGGKLYRANQNISTAESWTAAHWSVIRMGDAVASHVSDTSNPHNVTAAQVGAATAPAVGSISFSASWTGAASPYTQTVTVTGATVTASSKVDLQPTAAQIASLISDGVTGMVVENNSGTLTAYAVGAAPSSAMTVQCTVTEVTT